MYACKVHVHVGRDVASYQLNVDHLQKNIPDRLLHNYDYNVHLKGVYYGLYTTEGKMSLNKGTT